MGTKDLFADFKFSLGVSNLSRRKNGVLGIKKPAHLEPKLFQKPREVSWAKIAAKKIKKTSADNRGNDISLSIKAQSAKKSTSQRLSKNKLAEDRIKQPPRGGCPTRESSKRQKKGKLFQYESGKETDIAEAEDTRDSLIANLEPQETLETTVVQESHKIESLNQPRDYSQLGFRTNLSFTRKSLFLPQTISNSDLNAKKLLLSIPDYSDSASSCSSSEMETQN